MNPFMPFEVRITEECAHLEQSLAEIQFWQHTGATIIAVHRGDSILKSPGPYVALFKDDILYFLPQDDSPQRVKEFLYPNHN
jgi:K+/H+ antiporter YhaU regulatory subunit KhtT